jgi:predicted AAA+ superfamily ATPase
MPDLKTTLCRMSPWWDGGFSLEGVVPRPRLLGRVRPCLDTRDVILLTGLRRVGKTTLMRELVHHLLFERAVRADRVMYASLDAYPLQGVALEEIVDEFRRVHRHPFERRLFLFLDEVTAVVDWEQQLKGLHDGHDLKIVAASSSASVLREQKGFITGRSRTIEVSPLDFEEYLVFRGVHLTQSDRPLVEAYLDDYLRDGGMPGYVLTGDDAHLRQLADDIISKDIAAKHGVKSMQPLRDFFMLLMERAGKQVSLNKMAAVLGLSVDTARRYLGYFEDTFLVQTMGRYGKLNETLHSPKKLYEADLGMRVCFTGFRDVGALFESYVFQKLRDRRPRYVLQDGAEIDFMTEDKVLVEAKYGTELRPKQRQLFDSFPAKDRMVIGGVWDLAKLEPKPEDFLRQVFSKAGRATGGVREPEAEYQTGSGRRRTVQYGPPRGQMVVTRTR